MGLMGIVAYRANAGKENKFLSLIPKLAKK
jgi:hypothetical protein